MQSRSSTAALQPPNASTWKVGPEEAGRLTVRLGPALAERLRAFQVLLAMHPYCPGER